LNKEKIFKIFSEFQKQNPEPKGELEFVNTYTLLVAVVLSAQATDASVNKATKSLFKKVKSPKAMLALGEEGLKEYIKTIGLYNSKAKNVIKLSEQLVELHKGKVPEDMEALTGLAGVGRKTANVVLNIAFGHPTIAVDTHVFRLGNRIGLVHADNVEDTEKQLLKNIPPEFLQHAHHWLILHGRYICKARKPECAGCVIKQFCEFKDKTI